MSRLTGHKICPDSCKQPPVVQIFVPSDGSSFFAIYVPPDFW